MARIRTIKPEFFSNESLSQLSTATHLLAAALLCYADDEGYFNAHPGLVRAHCLPLRDDSVSVHGMLTELSDIGYIEIVQADGGKSLGRVVRFLDHQVISRPSASKLRKLWPFKEGYVNPHGVLTEDSPLNREQGTGKGKEQGGVLRTLPPLESKTKLATPKAKPAMQAAALQDDSAPADDALQEPLTCAKAMFEHLAITAPAKTLKLAAEAIRMQAAGLCMPMQASMLLIRRRAELCIQGGQTINAFWFEDSKWKSAAAAVVAATAPEPERAPEGADIELAERIWSGIRKEIRNAVPLDSFMTWVSPTKAKGVMDGVLYLQIPNPDFDHVPDRYDFAQYLPSGVNEIRILHETGEAA